MKRLLVLLVSILCIQSIGYAEVLFLKSGEKKVGKIVEYNKQSVIIETEDGEYVEQIPTSEINLITFDGQGPFTGTSDFQAEASGEVTIYLRNGEIIQGKITQYTGEFVTIESMSGQGVLQLPGSEIDMITTKKNSVGSF